MAVNLYMCLMVALCLSPAIICGISFVGGYSYIDPNRTDVQEAADFAVEKYNEAGNDVHIYRLLQIVSSYVQVVAGINYKLVVEIGRTSCQKNGGGYGLGDSCDVANSEVSQVNTCTFLIFKSLPPQSYSLINSDCK
ncbi:cystatin-like [Rhinoderma darwinii]|uniref:cystatin-like n=1 Tax=Rhinoderma darwinii TaxID=43563 RepID=UPI003F675832